MKIKSIPVSKYHGLSAHFEGFSNMEDIIGEMTSGELKPLSENLAAAKQEGKDAYKAVKERECPAFIIGRFPRKENNACEEYVPVLGLDIDGIRGDYEQRLICQKLEEIPYVLAAFPSVGGFGLRVLVATNATFDTHKKTYEAVCADLSRRLQVPTDKEQRRRIKAAQAAGETPPVGPVIDTGVNNQARIWFYAHVEAKDLYVNEDAATFTVDEGERPQPTRPAPAPVSRAKEGITEREKIDLALDKVARQSHHPVNGGRNAFVYAFACELCRFGVPKSTAIAECQAYIDTDFSETEIGKTIESAYSSKRFGEYSDRQLIAYRNRLSGRATEHTKAAAIVPAAAPMDATPAPVAATIEERKAPEPEPPLYLGENCYWFEETKGKTKSKERISNFVIMPLYLLLDSHEPKRVWLLRNMQGEEIVICFPSRYLSSPRDFCALIEGKGNFVFSANMKQFAALKEYLYLLEQKAQEIGTLGHQPETGHYAFAQGIFDGKDYLQADEYGIVRDGEKRYYLPAFSKVNELAEREYHNERKVLFRPGKATFEQWAKQLITVFGDNAVIGVCFVVAALFRDIIFAHVNAFPILFLFGPRGTGKTTYRLGLKVLFGNYGPNDAIGLGSQSSPKGFARKLAQIRNGLEAFEEYKNRINPSLIEMLKNIYDGIGYERAQSTNDNRTHATPVNSAVIVAGQEMPTKENALFSRVLMLSFGKTSHSDEAKREFHALETLIEDGLGNVLIEIITHREAVSAQFEKSFSEVYAHLRKDHTTNNMDERSLSNVAALLAPMKLLAEKLAFPFSYADAYKAFRSRLLSQNEQMAQSSEVVQFWRIFGLLIEKGLVRHNQHYKISEGKIAIHIDGIFEDYSKYCQNTGVTPLDQPTLESYLSMQPYFIPPPNEPGRIKGKVRMSAGIQKRCLLFEENFTESEFFKNLGTID